MTVTILPAEVFHRGDHHLSEKMVSFGVESGTTAPTILIEGYKFRFYSSDIFEPPHVHVLQGENVAKVWLLPVSVEYNRGYNQPEPNRILKLARENQERLLKIWNDYFSR